MIVALDHHPEIKTIPMRIPAVPSFVILLSCRTLRALCIVKGEPDWKTSCWVFLYKDKMLWVRVYKTGRMKNCPWLFVHLQDWQTLCINWHGSLPTNLRALLWNSRQKPIKFKHQYLFACASFLPKKNVFVLPLLHRTDNWFRLI